MKARPFSICSFLLALALLTTSLPVSNAPASAREPEQKVIPERYRPSAPETMQSPAGSAAMPSTARSTVGDVPLTWIWCSACPEPPEVSVAGNTITMGVANRGEHDWQNMASHGAAALLPASTKYAIGLEYDLYTWDSYQPYDMNYKGYWDSFSISISEEPYWQSVHTDPVTPINLPGLGFITGGSTWGQGILQHFSACQVVAMTGNPSADNYLNVILDTASSPDADQAYPSWGTITIVSIATSADMEAIAAEAAVLAPQVVGGPYGWGGQGWDWPPNGAGQWVEAQLIKNGGSYWYYVLADKQIEYLPGLDCEGLIMWAYNKAAGTVSRLKEGNPVHVEGAAAECMEPQSVSVNEEDGLSPGDLLCFTGHVAMYIGGSDPLHDVVEAANTVDGIILSSKDVRKTDPTFLGFRRLQPFTLPLRIQARSPVTLRVTDPDGITVDADTVVFTGHEYVHGIPGVLQYSTDESGDDYVWSPVLKVGAYTVQVFPKPDALPSDTFSLEAMGAAKLVELAQDIPISQIPSQPFGLLSTGEEIIPTQPTVIFWHVYVPLVSRGD